MAATAKRLGEVIFFSGAFGVFFYNNAIFCAFCLVIIIYFVYLHALKGIDTISHPEHINPKNYKYYVMR